MRIKELIYKLIKRLRNRGPGPRRLSPPLTPADDDNATTIPGPLPQTWLLSDCDVCGYELAFDEPLEPGQVAVVQCAQCATRWAAVLPSVQIVMADALVLKEDMLIHG